jgi:hypothetical protein
MITLALFVAVVGQLLAIPSKSMRVRAADGKWLDFIEYDLDDNGKCDFVDVFYDGKWVVGTSLPLVHGQTGGEVSESDLPSSSYIDVASSSFKYDDSGQLVGFSLGLYNGSTPIASVFGTTQMQKVVYMPISSVVSSTDDYVIDNSAELFPNPVQGQKSRLTLPMGAKITQVKLVDSQGTSVLLPFDSINDRELLADFSTVPSGRYVLEAAGLTQSFVVQLIVTK